VAWAGGATLESILTETAVAPGDFVRNIRQLIDLVRQLGQVAPDPDTRAAAQAAVALLTRGVVGADDPVGVGSAPDQWPRS
jgi:ATP-dependent RNA helicase HelY